MRIRYLCGVLFLALPIVQPLAHSVELAEVEEKALAAWEAVEAFSSDVALEATLPMNTLELEVSGTGKMHYQRADGAEKYRQNLTLTLPDTLSMESEVDILFDGSTLYVTNEMLGNREVTVSEVNFKNGAIPPGGSQLFSLLQANFDIEVLPDAEVEGAPAWVLQGSLKEDAPVEEMPFATIILHLDQDTGMVRRAELRKADGTTGATINYSDVEINPQIDPQVFDFRPPSIETKDEATPAPSPAAPETGGGGGEILTPAPPPPPPVTPPAAQGAAAT